MSNLDKNEQSTDVDKKNQENGESCKIRGCKAKAKEGESLFCDKHKTKALQCIGCCKWFLMSSMHENRCGKCFDKKLCKQPGGMYDASKSAEEVAQQFKVYKRAVDRISDLSDDDEEEDGLSTDAFRDYLDGKKSETKNDTSFSSSFSSSSSSSSANTKIDQRVKQKAKQMQQSLLHNQQRRKEAVMQKYQSLTVDKANVAKRRKIDS